MNIFLKRVETLQEEAQAGPSGEIPEENIVSIGSDNFWCVISRTCGDTEVEDVDIDDI